MTQDAAAALESLISQLKAHEEALLSAAFILCEQKARIRELEAQHRDLVLRNKLLRDRPDLPMERLVAYQDVVALFDERDAELAALKARLREHGVSEEEV